MPKYEQPILPGMPDFYVQPELEMNTLTKTFEERLAEADILMTLLHQGKIDDEYVDSWLQENLPEKYQKSILN